MRHLRQIFLMATIVLLPSAAADSYACQCREPQPVCAEYRDAKAVFIGSVVEIERTESEPGERISFKIERPFHGVEGGGAKLINLGTSCDYSFKEGRRYLVYAYRKATTGTLSTHLCSRTREISEAAADLSYIAKAATGPDAKLITGILADGEKRLSRILVTAESARKIYRSSSDRNGWFNLAVPEVGEYKVRIFLPHDVGVAGTADLLDKISGTAKTKRHYIVEYVVEVRAGGCTFIDVPLFIFGRGANKVRSRS